MNLKNKILNEYSNLKGAYQKIADKFLEDSQVFLKYDAIQLGEQTNTSSATIIRFCQYLGFKGLKDFKIELAQESPNEKKDPKITSIVSEKDSTDIVLKKLAYSIKKNANDTFKLIDIDIFKKCIELIKKAHEIYIAGVGASSLPAADLYYKFVRTGRKVVFHQDSHIFLENIYFSTPKDVLIVFSYSGLTKEILLLVQQARKNQTPIIAVTRAGNSPLVDLSDVVIGLPTKEKLLRVGAVDSLFSEMYVSSSLFLATINENLSVLEKRMRGTESLTNQLKVNQNYERK